MLAYDNLSWVTWFFLNRLYKFKIEQEYIDASILYSIQVVFTVILVREPTLLYATETAAFRQTKGK